MKKADLHCHTIHSEHPTEWFLQKLGAKESYTDPLFLYKEAKRQGMDFVSITDHNKIDGALRLKALYPHDVIVGVEATSYFPEDQCKIHILIYGIDEEQFEEINLIRKDIYELRDYLRDNRIAHSVAHASYSVNGKLTITHLEKLILLFDNFETVNGGRNKKSNLDWKHILDHLNAGILHDLYRKHGIEPISPEPWKKSYTGGSDDHGGLFIGQSFTMARAETVDEFLEAIRSKNTNGVGRHNDYHSLAFTVYKIAYDFSKQQTAEKRKGNLLNILTENLFESRSLNMKTRIKVKTLKNLADLKGDELKQRLSELIEALQNHGSEEQDAKLDRVYTHISSIVDAYFRILLVSLEEDVKDLNLLKLIRNVGISLPGIFLLIPFFSSLKHMHQSHALVSEFRLSHKITRKDRKRRSLWFTDTINDLNGVSVTLKQMGQIAHEDGRELRIAASLKESELSPELPDNLMNLPYMYAFNLPYYENYNLKIPSILNCLKLINDFEPDQIIISTPGPMGLLGLLAAKLIGIPAIGIYHTDFCGEALHLIQDESASRLVLAYEQWFYNQMSEIRTPTKEYMHILRERNIEVNNMKLLRRGIELDTFSPRKNRKSFLDKHPEMADAATLLYAGRVSSDKSLHLLVEAYKELVHIDPALNLIVAGSGPYLAEMKEALAGYPGVLFTGAISRSMLPQIYNAADFFVFPSVTDTFGMVILESQACGLPVIVSAFGGPKEMVIHAQNGYVVRDQDISTWVSQISEAISLYKEDPAAYQRMREESRATTESRADWDAILNDLLGADMAD